MVGHFAYLPSDESNRTTPMGNDAQAIIVYTSDGYMSAQFLTFQEAILATDGPGEPKSSPSSTTTSNFMAYAGEFYLMEASAQAGPIIKHHARITNVAHLNGIVQSRTMQISDESDGTYLELGSVEPITFSGEDRMIKVRWRRLPRNAHGDAADGPL